MHFAWWNILYFDSDFTKFVPMGHTCKKSELIQAKAWRWTSDSSWSEPMLNNDIWRHKACWIFSKNEDIVKDEKQDLYLQDHKHYLCMNLACSNFKQNKSGNGENVTRLAKYFRKMKMSWKMKNKIYTCRTISTICVWIWPVLISSKTNRGMEKTLIKVSYLPSTDILNSMVIL